MRDSVDGSALSLAAGVIPRAINQIFEHVKGIGGDLNTVKCSFLELYNEETTDLLAVGDAVDQKLKMLEDNGRVVVQVAHFCLDASFSVWMTRHLGEAVVVISLQIIGGMFGKNCIALHKTALRPLIAHISQPCTLPSQKTCRGHRRYLQRNVIFKSTIAIDVANTFCWLTNLPVVNLTGP